MKHDMGRLATKHKNAFYSWRDMKTRCNNPKNKSYKDYGGRGIKVCLRWNKFANFLEDMGDPPVVFGVRLTLDRKDNNGDYTKENCKWSTYTEQRLNARSMSRILPGKELV